LVIKYDDEGSGEVPTPVSGCVVKNITSNWISHSFFRGVPDGWLTGVEMSNMHVDVNHPIGKSEGYLFYLDEDNPHASFRIENVSVDWNGHRARWRGVTNDATRIDVQIKS
jgi:hypothetical protein